MVYQRVDTRQNTVVGRTEEWDGVGFTAECTGCHDEEDQYNDLYPPLYDPRGVTEGC